MRLFITCPSSGQPIFTGVTMEKPAFDKSWFEAVAVRCPHCHRTHVWDKTDAFFESLAEPRVGVVEFR